MKLNTLTMFFLDDNILKTIKTIIVSVSVLYGLAFLLSLLPNYKSAKMFLSIKNYFLLILTLTAIVLLFNYKSISRGLNPWSDSDIAEIEEGLLNDSTFNSLPFSAADKQRIINCMVEKGKKKFPKGLTGKQANLNDEFMTIGKECGSLIFQDAKMNGWNDKFEQLLHDRYDLELKETYADDNERSIIAWCCVDKLKARYPTGVDFKDLTLRSDTIFNKCFVTSPIINTDNNFLP